MDEVAPPPYTVDPEALSLVTLRDRTDDTDSTDGIEVPSDEPPSYEDAQSFSFHNPSSKIDTDRSRSWSTASIASKALSSLFTAAFRPWQRVSPGSDLLRHERYNSREWVDSERGVRVQRYLEANVAVSDNPRCIRGWIVSRRRGFSVFRGFDYRIQAVMFLHAQDEGSGELGRMRVEISSAIHPYRLHSYTPKDESYPYAGTVVPTALDKRWVMLCRLCVVRVKPKRLFTDNDSPEDSQVERFYERVNDMIKAIMKKGLKVAEEEQLNAAPLKAIVCT